MLSFLASVIVGTPTLYRHPSAGSLALPMLASLVVGYELSSSSNPVAQAGLLLLLSILGLASWHWQRKRWGPSSAQPAAAVQEPASPMQALSSQVLEACGDAVIVSDGLDRIVMANPAFFAMTGLAPSEVIGRPAELVGMPPLRDSHLAGVRGALDSGLRWYGESTQLRADGQPIDTCLTVSALCNDAGQVTQHIRTFNDITAIKQQQRVLAEQARHDSLTGLPNRRAFGERLQQAMSRARRQPHTLAVLYVDLDGFKQVNDAHGHAVGDQLLIEVSRRLDACVRLTDCVCRLSGDEFTVILEGAGHPEEVQRIGKRILERLSLPHALAGLSLVVTPSIGGTLFRAGDSGEVLCRRADDTMYEAKRSGKARFVLDLRPMSEGVEVAN